ncbi:ATP-binding cassette domain-containing protein [Mobilicoccus pelagius]|uniref:Putative ABC transporter ATP-binding protein n=1 Tax=Mobilicoccus pelagius NBRC 104925 TaxID=1089455 RepID=H5UUG4_9MICO|nr:ATP-binding cassette domain-containing protein [Mobilicoccus pelagius]GAB49372.1 putative ABC transporter ATP-binding protein [Mobilicoccus pelagius NBRC 104925]
MAGVSVPEAPVMRLRGVSKSYAGRPVLSGLDLDIRPEVTVLLGPNGAGKSTLLDLLSLVAPPQAGMIEWHGEEMRRTRQVKRAMRGISYLPQHFSFPSSYTAADVVDYAAWLRKVRAPRRAGEVLAMVGLEGEARKKVRTMSGGMRQRLGIATCLIGDPELIVLDEPTVGLDPAQRIQFRRVLSSVDAAVLLSTHLVEDAVVLADRVLVLHEGRFVFDGSLPELEALAGPVGDSPAERGYMSLIGATR